MVNLVGRHLWRILLHGVIIPILSNVPSPQHHPLRLGRIQDLPLAEAKAKIPMLAVPQVSPDRTEVSHQVS